MRESAAYQAILEEGGAMVPLHWHRIGITRRVRLQRRAEIADYNPMENAGLQMLWSRWPPAKKMRFIGEVGTMMEESLHLPRWNRRRDIFPLAG